MWIELNEIEIKLAKYVAKKRFESNRNLNYKNMKIGNQSNEETDTEGVGAEIAFCKVFNIYPDLEIGIHPHYNAVTNNGNRVDIKTTKYKNGHLLVSKWKKELKKPDVYILVVGKFPRYRLAGFISPKQLLVEGMIKNIGHGESYTANQNELKPIEELR